MVFAPQNRVPLGDVETFPRPLVIYALSSESVGESCIVSDINPETQKATLLINGAADYHQVLDQVAAIASSAGMTPGYRSQRGGGPRVQQARSEGILHHYNEDRHQVASTEQEQDQAVITFRCVGRCLVFASVWGVHGQRLWRRKDWPQCV